VKHQLVSFASAVWLSCGVIPAVGGGEIVLANRSIQAQGTSHSQLFLYREDGTFLRQLTRDNSGQMIDPIFAPDGETIVFTREVGDHKDFWSMPWETPRRSRCWTIGGSAASFCWFSYCLILISGKGWAFRAFRSLILSVFRPIKKGRTFSPCARRLIPNRSTPVRLDLSVKVL